MDSNHPSDHNAISNALTDIINELGSTPRGSAATLSARITDIEANDWVTTARIATAAVTAAEIATNAVEEAKINAGAVTAAKLATDAVETVKIKDANVTAVKLATNAVETAKINDGAVTNAKLNTAAGQPGGAWQDYTATWTGVANGTKTARYLQIGKTVWFWAQLVITGTSYPTANVTVTLPVTAAATVRRAQFNAQFWDKENSRVFPAAVRDISTTVVTLAALQVSSPDVYSAAMTASVPFGWGADDNIEVSGTYEAA